MPERDSLLTEFGKATLMDRYVLEGETPQGLFARVAAYYADDEEHAQRLYDYISKHWFMPSTPILSNGGTKRGLPISCFLNETEDSLKGIVDLWNENVWLASGGGGIGSYWGNLRGMGEKVGKRGETCGIIPFIKVMDSQTLAISQGSLRRGSAAVYLPIHHPEIDEFIDIRRPVGGDVNRRSLNIHHGVCITDDFMAAVENDTSYDLVSPKDGSKVKTVNARTLWIKLLTTRLETGEPYMMFTDTVNRLKPDIYKQLNLKVKTSNLCVTPETLLLTKEYGHVSIIALEQMNKEVSVWNGKTWSICKIYKTGIKKQIVRVNINGANYIDCTPEHKFFIQTKYTGSKVQTIAAKDLKEGMKLIKVDYPFIEGNTNLTIPYLRGFFSAEGCILKNGKALLHIYGEKKKLIPILNKQQLFSGSFKEHACGRLSFMVNTEFDKEYVPSHAIWSKDRLAWLAGVLDGDGCVARNGTNQSLQLCSINKQFLVNIRLMLQTLGINSRINNMSAAGLKDMPGGNYYCQDAYRLLIDSVETQKLLELGLELHRLKVIKHSPNRQATHFLTIKNVEYNDTQSDTYCLTEPLRHTVIFNGVPTSQCNEIYLTTGKDYFNNDRTAVCCLSSVNLEYYDEWKENELFIKDILRFLDNILDDFIDNAPESMSKAVYAAIMERSIGLGVMGFHSYLQSKNIPFDCAIAKSTNLNIFKHLEGWCYTCNNELSKEKGSCPDARRVGINKRFTHVTAIAPTASISIITGTTSPSIDPITANIYNHKTLSGSFTVTNKYLIKLLESKDKNTKEVWSDIIRHEGSVQQLDFLTQEEKDVFKTALEINPYWIIEHAADRVQYIDQGQSVNLWLPANINKKDLNQIHYMAWKKGLKGLYYCRSTTIQPADKISKQIKYESCIACE